MIATASDDATARLWPIDPKAFLERIRAIANLPCLTIEERRLFFPAESLNEANDKARACSQTQNAIQRK